MARKVLVTLTDDLDGNEAAQTVSFAYQGKSYEIDLSDKNVAKLEKALAPFMEAGRKSGGRRRSHGGSGIDARAIRAWAAEQGIALSSRGRIPREIIEQYNAS